MGEELGLCQGHMTCPNVLGHYIQLAASWGLKFQMVIVGCSTGSRMMWPYRRTCRTAARRNAGSCWVSWWVTWCLWTDARDFSLNILMTPPCFARKLTSFMKVLGLKISWLKSEFMHITHDPPPLLFSGALASISPLGSTGSICLNWKWTKLCVYEAQLFGSLFKCLFQHWKIDEAQLTICSLQVWRAAVCRSLTKLGWKYFIFQPNIHQCQCVFPLQVSCLLCCHLPESTVQLHTPPTIPFHLSHSNMYD